MKTRRYSLVRTAAYHAKIPEEGPSIFGPQLFRSQQFFSSAPRYPRCHDILDDRFPLVAFGGRDQNSFLQSSKLFVLSLLNASRIFSPLRAIPEGLAGFRESPPTINWPGAERIRRFVHYHHSQTFGCPGSCRPRFCPCHVLVQACYTPSMILSRDKNASR